MTLIKVNTRGTENIGGRRNLIINGAMQVAQRGTVTNAAPGIYGGADRYQFSASGGADATLSQDTDVPTGQGFTSSQKVDVTTSGNMSGSGHYAMIRQKIEGQNLQLLLYGTSSAKKLTLQFWVKSPKTGTHIVELYHGDVNYFNSQTYTIASANTWQKVTLTFDGYQTTALDNDSGIGIQLAWWLGASTTYNSGTFSSNTWHNDAAKRAVGQVNVFDDASNNFYFTGVQLEVGDTASDFEHRSFAEELSLCQRYYFQINFDAGENPLGAYYDSNRSACTQAFHVQMRIDPTVTSTFSSGGLQADYSNEHCFRWYGNAQQISVATAKAEAEL